MILIKRLLSLYLSKSTQSNIIISKRLFDFNLKRDPQPQINNTSNESFFIESKEKFPIDEINSKLHLLTNPTSDVIDKINLIIEEIESAKLKRKRIPDYLKPAHLNELLILKNPNQRLKYLAFLFIKEKKKLNQIAKKEKQKQERLLKKECNLESSNSHLEYGLSRNTLFIQLRGKGMKLLYEKRLALAVLFGSKIVIDLDYEEFMWRKERFNCAAQLKYLFSTNRINPYPFDLYFCNAKPSSVTVKALRLELPRIDDPCSFISLTESSYLDIFPKEKLVYLSPHANEELEYFDHNAVYIIGGFVDIVKKQPISFEKATKEGIKSYSLPISKHVLWGSHCKSLSINQAFEIMLILKNTGDWKKAFSAAIPPRKIHRVDPSDIDTQKHCEKIYLIDKKKQD